MGKNIRITGGVEVSHNGKKLKDKNKGKGIFLDGYYSIRLGLCGDIELDLEKLCEFYLDRMSDNPDSGTVKETLLEYINLFNSRDLCGQEIVAEKISMISKKGDDKKKNINYLIGCFRNVLEYGLSSTGSDMEKRLVKAFEDRYNFNLSSLGTTRLLSLAANFGTTEVLFSLLETPMNLEKILFDKFETVLQENNTLVEKG